MNEDQNGTQEEEVLKTEVVAKAKRRQHPAEPDHDRQRDDHGLRERIADREPVVQAFVDAQAAQCGYCLNGMVMMVARLLRDQPDADDQALLRELSGNLCRCGAHVEILQAARLAAQRCRDRA